MSFIPVIHMHASPSALAICFSLLLVACLVAVEEGELRRRSAPGQAGG